MKKFTKCILFSTATAIGCMYAYNKVVEHTAASYKPLERTNSYFFSWKHGDIYYEKMGSGQPVLLVHDMYPYSSSVEFEKLAKKLSRKHTVYTMDLLGCGKSDKPAIVYTNYLYVQLITDFIKKVIGEPTDLITYDISSSFALMANHMEPSLFRKILLLNPCSQKQLMLPVSPFARMQRMILNAPIIGSFLFNFSTRKTKIASFYQGISKANESKIVDAAYAATHDQNSNGKYLFSSIQCKYLNVNISPAIKQCQNNVHVIIAAKNTANIQIANEYHKKNNKITIHNLYANSTHLHIDYVDAIYKIFEQV